MTDPSVAEPRPELDQCWGIARRRTLHVLIRPLTRHLSAMAAALITTAALLLGLAGTTVASTSTANADIFGVSDAVEDWICGIVSPTEPWETVGDGPESLISNRNLAGFTPPPTIVVTAAGERITRDQVSTEAPASMVDVPALPAGQPATLYELAGLRGLSWWTIPIAPDGTTRSCDLWNYMFSQMGNGIFTLNKLLLQVVISIKEAAAADDPLAFLYDGAGGAISTAFTMFFVPMAILALICTGMWVALSAVRGRGARATLGAAAAGAAVMVLGGFAYGANVAGGDTGFRAVSHVADGMISTVSAAATNALFDGFTNGQGACALPTDGDNPARGQRTTSCVLADSLAYRPWAIGQFGAAGAARIPLPDGWTVVAPAADGTIPAAAIAGEHTLPCYVDFDECGADLRTYLIAQHGGLQVGDRLSGQNGYFQCTAGMVKTFADALPWASLDSSEGAAITLLVSTPCSPMYRVFQILVASDQRTAAAYAGDVGIARMSQATSSLIGTVVVGIPILVIAVITMGWIAYTFALWISGPFKLGFAVYVGKVKIAREWLGDLMYAWLARLAYGIVLSLTILIVAWMMAADLSFGMRLLWLGIILYCFWKLIGKVQELIRPESASAGNDLATGAQDKIIGAIGRTSAAGMGVKDGLAVQRELINDPNRGTTRRVISALATPLAAAGGAARGVTGRPARSLPISSRIRITYGGPTPADAADDRPAATIPADHAEVDQDSVDQDDTVVDNEQEPIASDAPAGRRTSAPPPPADNGPDPKPADPPGQPAPDRRPKPDPAAAGVDHPTTVLPPVNEDLGWGWGWGHPPDTRAPSPDPTPMPHNPDTGWAWYPADGPLSDETPGDQSDPARREPQPNGA